MKGILADLVSLLGLERLDRDLFRGRSQDLGWGAIFGGQVVGQALSAAAQTVGSGRIVHSLHGYFMRAGDVRGSIVYQIDRLRDGKSFTTRRVVAVQEGEAIFSLEASFQSDEDGLDHQDAMPQVPAPETAALGARARARARRAAPAAPAGARHRRAPDRDPPGRAARPAPPGRRPAARAWRGTARSTSSPTTRRSTATCSPTRRTSRSSGPRSIRTR